MSDLDHAKWNALLADLELQPLNATERGLLADLARDRVLRRTIEGAEFAALDRLDALGLAYRYDRRSSRLLDSICVRGLLPELGL